MSGKLMMLRLVILYLIFVLPNAIAAKPMEQKNISRGQTMPVPVPPLEQAFNAFKTGQYVQARILALPLAETGEAGAMTLLGEIYVQGLGIEKNIAEAVKWYQKAADKGDRFASFALASMLYDGQGIAKDPSRATFYFLKAAEAGHAGAQYNVGLNILNSEPAKAAAWFEKSAAQGNGEAAYVLAQLYKDGKGVAQDDVKTTQFLKQGAEAGSRDAMTEYAIRLFNGIGTAKDEAAAGIWFEKAARLGSAIAQNRLAKLYWKGRGVIVDPITASAWHMKARAQGLNDPDLDGLLFTLSIEDKKKAEALSVSSAL